MYINNINSKIPNRDRAIKLTLFIANDDVLQIKTGREDSNIRLQLLNANLYYTRAYYYHKFISNFDLKYLR